MLFAFLWLLSAHQADFQPKKINTLFYTLVFKTRGRRSQRRNNVSAPFKITGITHLIGKMSHKKCIPDGCVIILILQRPQLAHVDIFISLRWFFVHLVASLSGQSIAQEASR